MEITNLLKSESYKIAKLQYEKEYFKLFGEYCSINCKNEPIIKSASMMKEYFKNKMIFADIEEEAFDKKGNKLNITDASIMNKTFLGVDTILYPAVEKTKPQIHGKLARR